MLAFSPVWRLFVPVVKQNLAKQNNNIRNDYADYVCIYIFFNYFRLKLL